MSSTSPNQASKRKRVPGVDASNIIEGESRRTKRRKDGSPFKVSGSTSSLAGDEEVGSDEPKLTVSEMGYKLLETLRKATNSDGVNIAGDFKKLPNKRQYPDYYELIKQPIAFDDIRSRIDSHGYATLEDVKADFDLCFKNAKRYNKKNSDIWIAARDLQKLAATTCKAMQPNSPDTDDKDMESEDEDEDDDEESDAEAPSKSGGEKRRAGRPPQLHKKYETRLNRLIEKQSPDGYYYSDIFMDLVPRKDYPDYYQIIKKPISFNVILKRIKSKTYSTPKAFMDDVELVFTNAVTYNEDHSPIWEDAKVLQSAFHALCADWRAELGYTNGDAGSSGAAVPKLKLKVPPVKAESATPITAQIGLAPTPPTATQPLQSHSTTSDPLRSNATAASTPVAPAPSYSRPTPPILPAHLRTSTPSHLSRSPSVQAPHPPAIKAVELVTYPAKRRIPIHQGGIARLNAWSIRLGWNESSVALTVQLASTSASSPAPVQNGITNGNGINEPDAVEIKHNTAAVVSKPGIDKKAQWDVPLVIGMNVLEVRVRGTGHPGNVWRISVDRTM